MKAINVLVKLHALNRARLCLTSQIDDAAKKSLILNVFICQRKKLRDCQHMHVRCFCSVVYTRWQFIARS